MTVRILALAAALACGVASAQAPAPVPPDPPPPAATGTDPVVRPTPAQSAGPRADGKSSGETGNAVMGGPPQAARPTGAARATGSPLSQPMRPAGGLTEFTGGL